MIEVRELTERYGDKKAVDGLSFTVKPGEVTGFLGPDGAGKSTTMRMIIGLDAPTSGTATIGGRRYAQHSAPLQEIGHRPAHLRHGGGPLARRLGRPEAVSSPEQPRPRRNRWRRSWATACWGPALRGGPE